LNLPQPLKIELIQDKPASEPEDKVADWAGAVQQLRTIAQWVMGGVIAAIVAIFATSAFARLGLMDPGKDFWRLALAGIGFGLSITAIATIFHFGLRVVVPPGSSLRILANAPPRSTSGKARSFLYTLHNLDEAKHPLREMLEDCETDDAKWYLPRFRRVLSFAVAKTHFDQMVRALYLSLPFAMAGMLLFTWAANPPEPVAPPPEHAPLSITIRSDGTWERTVTTTTAPEDIEKSLPAALRGPVPTSAPN
jgi:hypothetical protein